MAHFVKRRKDDKIYQIRVSKLDNGYNGDFDYVWEILKENKWTVIETPKHSEYTFAVKYEEVKNIPVQIFIDSFI